MNNDFCWAALTNDILFKNCLNSNWLTEEERWQAIYNTRACKTCSRLALPTTQIGDNAQASKEWCSDGERAVRAGFDTLVHNSHQHESQHCSVPQGRCVDYNSMECNAVGVPQCTQHIAVGS